MDNIPKKILTTYSNIYFPKKKEHYDRPEDVIYMMVMGIVAWIILGFAVYLSFKCNDKFILGDVLLAVLFSPLYIIYHLFATKLCGMMK